ncbi:MAG: hypothetical protein HS110_13480 [Zoogloeaceae bacterium]|nr:hypothetical protein [Zoogloeaceae bacterium]
MNERQERTCFWHSRHRLIAIRLLRHYQCNRHDRSDSTMVLLLFALERMDGAWAASLVKARATVGSFADPDSAIGEAARFHTPAGRPAAALQEPLGAMPT